MNFSHFITRISALIVICLTLTTFGDIEPIIADNGLSVGMKNNTANSWTLGGVRFENGGYVWTGNDNGYPTSYFAINNKTVNGDPLLDLYFKSNAPGFNTAKLNPTETRTFSHPWASAISGADKVEGNDFLLLRTGSSGVPDDPIGADPITIEQLDSLSQLSDFYSSSYRYDVYDSLGVRGGKYSGGFMDTWLGETQVQFAIPPNGFNVNMTPTTIDTVNLPKMYWMAIALAQEYMNVDMQWMGAMASKESFSGTVNHLTADLNQGGVYTPWHVENSTGLDRAMAYPVFFPKYQVQLASAADVTSSGVDPDNFLKYYCRNSSGTTELNSATTISAIMVSIAVQYNNYDVFAAAADICWKESLEISRNEGDPFMGLAAMVASYNLGQWGQIGNVAGQLGAASYETNAKLPAPLGRDLFPTGNGDYRNQIINVAQAFTDASRLSLTDNSITLLDFDISKEELLDVFFGDNGTVATQGEGGLLRNFYEEDKNVQRQEIWNTVSAAFELLKGKSPSTTGEESISYRYDFLGILRTVKSLMSFKREFRSAGDASILIPQHSKIGGCSNIEIDDIYPYLSWTSDYNTATDDYTISMTVDDEIESKDVKWTLAYDWTVWNTVATPNTGGSTTTKTFDVVIPKVDVEYYRSLGDGYSGYYVWVMGTDLSGNSTIKRLPVPFKSPEQIDSVAAYDSDGDGEADNIKAYIEPGGNTDIGDFGSITYSWPDKTSPTKVYPADVTASGKIITITDNSLLEGAGLGEFDMEVDTAFGIGTPNGKWVSIGPADILDRVGPVIDSVPNPLYIVPATASDMDTLKLTFSEPIQDLASSGTFLQFKVGSGAATSENANLITKISSTEYVFVFSNGTLSGYTDVKILASSDLKDEVDNSAADNNQWVPLSKQELTDPSLDFASVKDTDGDGYGDFITYKITKGSSSDDAFDFGDLDELKYKWNQNGSETDVTIGNATITSGETLLTFDIDIATNGAYGDGEGEAKMNFNKSGKEYPLSGKIIDSVGPAIVSAEYIVGKDSDPCTLTVILTEEIEDNLTSGTQYLVLDDGTKISQSAINKKGAKEYEFIVTPGTISDGDEVKLIHNSGLTDASAQKNPPLENNILQEIIYIDAINKITSVEYYDTDANGTMDKVVINFQSSVDQTENVDKMSFKVNWIDEDGNAIVMSVSGTDCIKTDAKQIEWTVNSNNYKLKEDLTSLKGGYGHVSITQVNDNTQANETTDYGDTIAVDKMAPVLVSANYYKYKSGGKADELSIKYSEVVSLNTTDEPFIFNEGDYKLFVKQDIGLDTKADSLAIYVYQSGSTLPVYPDSININVSAKIEDPLTNEQNNKDNKHVKVNVFSAIGINSVAYFENSSRPDGRIDEIRVYTDTEVPEDLLSAVFDNLSLPADRYFDAIASSDLSLEDYGFKISVKQDLAFDKDGWSKVSTEVTDTDKLEITALTSKGAYMFMNDTLDILDSLAPVIKHGYLKPAVIDESNIGETVRDTFVATFSEYVKGVTDDEPFNFIIDDNSVAFTLTPAKDGQYEGVSIAFLVEDNKDEILMQGDSVQVAGDADIGDNSSIKQDKNTFPVPVEIGPYSYKYKPYVYPNPLKRGDEEQLNSKVEGFIGVGIPEDEATESTIAIMVKPFGFVLNSEDIEANLKIFDMVGNEVVEGVSLEFVQNDDNKQVWYYVWDTENTKMRAVGSGVYLGVITLKDNKEDTEAEYKISIGIGD